MELNFRLEKNGENLVIAVAQDWQTNEVLMVAFMNRQAVEETLKTKKAHYYSTSRGKQWLKGESSGNIQKWTKKAQLAMKATGPVSSDNSISTRKLIWTISQTMK